MNTLGYDLREVLVGLQTMLTLLTMQVKLLAALC
jgi:hypothetical protein